MFTLKRILDHFVGQTKTEKNVCINHSQLNIMLGYEAVNEPTILQFRFFF